MGLVRPAVLELAMGLDIGGAENHIVSLGRSLKTRGWEVLVASSGGRRVRDILEAGIAHFHVPLSSRSPAKMLEAHIMLKKMIDEHPVHVIHAHARIPAWIATPLARKRGIPLVTTYHGTFVSGFPWNVFTRPGDWTIAVSEDIKRYIVREFRFREDRVTVIPNGIDCDDFKPVSPEEARLIRESLGIPPESGPVVVYASRLTADLAATACEVIQAVSRLLASHPHIVLLIAGDGPYLGQVQSSAQAINERAGREIVRCLGFVADMAPLYQACDMVIGMSLVVMEAMACGKRAIVAGPQGDYGPVTAEILETLEARNFTSRDAPRPVDPKILAEEVRLVLSGGPSLAPDAARDHILRHHSSEVTASQVEEVYRMLTGQ